MVKVILRKYVGLNLVLWLAAYIAMLKHFAKLTKLCDRHTVHKRPLSSDLEKCINEYDCTLVTCKPQNNNLHHPLTIVKCKNSINSDVLWWHLYILEFNELRQRDRKFNNIKLQDL